MSTYDTLLNIEDMALYGMSALWAEKVFTGAKPTNNDGWLNTEICSRIFGRTVCGPEVYTPFGDNTNLALGYKPYRSGSELTGFQITEGLFGWKHKPNSSELIPVSKELRNSYAVIFNNIAQYNSESNPLTLYRTNNFETDLYSYWGIARGGAQFFKTYPIKTYIDKSNFSSENITFQPKKEAVSSTQGVIATQTPSIDSTVQPFTFTFTPGMTASRTFTYSSSQTASYTTTSGTKTTTSNSIGTSFDITNSVTAEAGIKAGPVEAKSGISQSISNGWSNAWSSMKEVNFSESNETSSTDTTSTSITIDPGTTTENPNGTYIYTHEIDQPDGTVITNTVGFVPAVSYTAHVTRNLSSINNNLTGVYEIKGIFGTLSDSENVFAVSPTASQALVAAHDYNYNAIQNTYGLGFGNASKYVIDFSGAAIGNANISTGWDLTYAENAEQSIDSNPINSSALQSLQNQSVDLTTYDSSKLDKLGVSYTFHEDSTGTKSVTGSGYTDIVYASTSGTHAFSNFKDSFLHGNENADSFILNKKNSGNSIDTFGGNDTLKASSSQVVNLGSGDDTYIISKDSTENSKHQIHTGDGEDTLIINSMKNVFTIADFNPFMDTVKVGASLDKDLLTGILVPFEKGREILDNAKIQFYYDGSPIGIAYLSSDSDFIQKFVAPLTHQSIYMLNTAEFKDEQLKDGLSAYENFAKSVISGVAYSRPITPKDWESMDNAHRAEIMTELSSLSGLDVTKENHLDTLMNHQNPSNFNQVMFGNID